MNKPTLYNFRKAQMIAYELAYEDPWRYEVEFVSEGLYKIAMYDGEELVGYWYE